VTILARIRLTARAVQDQAYVLADIDGFMVLSFAVIGALVFMLLLRARLRILRPAAGDHTPSCTSLLRCGQICLAQCPT
jgi:hypothetical protein